MHFYLYTNWFIEKYWVYEYTVHRCVWKIGSYEYSSLLPNTEGKDEAMVFFAHVCVHVQ